MATIVPQMAKLSVKDLLETRQRLEADIDKLLTDFTALTGVEVEDIDFRGPPGSGFVYVFSSTGASAQQTCRVSVELSL